ncbi:MAG: hypothetical protein EMLJLAPB_00834 [Candidatus Argoarchaeum ethanivorans]|uniref:Uncharacterized protein n=1 Tax=Candidatus Argoarchaeum ethanivorans TaxID=2608793 RepID=A0A811TFB5_9EURY|nr:MAG: hypothetical protein EMLJLAPB_00834 [Candidatus Argoarchaeum ethanivorans]
MNSIACSTRLLAQLDYFVLESYFNALDYYRNRGLFPHNEVVRFCRTKYTGVKLI